MGPELDTNPARVTGEGTDSYDGEAQTAAPLLRVVLDGPLSASLGRHLLLGSYGGGGKLYATDAGRLADEIVQHAALSWALRGKMATLRLGGQYYEAFLREPSACGGGRRPCPPRRDFRNGRAEATLALLRDMTRGVLTLGYSRLVFKPAPLYSYHGLRLRLGLRRAWHTGPADAGAEWGIGATYAAALRLFGSPIQVAVACPGSSTLDCSAEGDVSRRDVNHRARLDLDYLGAASARLFYSLEMNRSKSYGETYLRQMIGLQFTVALPASFFLTAQGVLQLSRFSDPLFSAVAQQGFVDIDAENRSRLLIHLAWDVSSHWSLSMRYALYLNESGSNSQGQTLPGFFRQTLFFGLRFEYDSDA
ncbi:MAG: hypothetical protein KAI47_05625 [Deltaproteobacteria bacterium]|nr:hypothetical protein [Deltaproteobacteria bacterium]